MLHCKRTIIGSALALASLGMLASTVQAQSVFPDVPDNHWAAAAVKRLAEAGIIVGVAPKPAPGIAKVASVASKKKAAGARHEAKTRRAHSR